MMNEDEMATEKLSEGIRKFAADSRALETMLKSRLSSWAYFFRLFVSLSNIYYWFFLATYKLKRPFLLKLFFQLWSAEELNAHLVALIVFVEIMRLPM